MGADGGSGLVTHSSSGHMVLKILFKRSFNNTQEPVIVFDLVSFIVTIYTNLPLV